MAKADRSGIRVQNWMLPVIFAMLNCGDRKHDIAAWFGLNQGRVKGVEDGQYGKASPAPMSKLPPSGSPGPRALEIRDAVDEIRKLIKAGDADAAIKRIDAARTEFDKNV